MSANSFEIGESKIKDFGEKLTIAMADRNYKRMEDAAEAFVGLFEGENIVAIYKFIEHVRIVCNGLNDYYDRKRIISPESLNVSRGCRRLNLQNNSDKDPDQHLHE